MPLSKPPFSKLLIANRGEIACRVIRTARAMGIATVAVHSEADAGALHVRLADEAIAIGPAPSAQSYLVAERIIEAIRDSGAQAVHPGYGFLSENAAFVARLADEGIAFIGPPAPAIAAMGDKIEAKKLAARAGVSTIPGHAEAVSDPDEAVPIAQAIGYPVMIKASAGGGGKGMRIAHNDDEVRDGLRSAANEARSSFGDDRVFLEKFIEQPRHIEIQMLADSFGNTVYLGERECSIQRRHQKVIEECPSPFLDEPTRAAMGAQAVALAKAVDYASAGTVEFIVDRDRQFYFLEMNTRLQVEHPVTELVTGLDLVEQMIRIAAGEALEFGQADVQLSGHALECRIYAEDPSRGFLPSVGRLTSFRPSPDEPTLRLDTGVEEGSEISIYYDPMIAKLCAHGADRRAALSAMQAALDGFRIEGLDHNLLFLSAVMANPAFEAGDTTTDFIAREYGDAYTGREPDEDECAALAAIATAVHLGNRARELAIAERPGERAPDLSGEWVVRLGAADRPVHVTPSDAGLEIRIGERTLVIESRWRPGRRVFEGRINGLPTTALLDPGIEGVELRWRGVRMHAVVRRPRAAEIAALMPEKQPPDTSRLLLSPMPGLVVSVDVAEGDEVKAGQPLAVIDAMKMENQLRAERDGRIARICAGAGDSLVVDQVILEFE